jgi:hypothetical protein
MTAGTGQQHLESAMTRANLRDKPVPGGRAGRIADQDQATGLGGHLLQRLATPADQDQVGPFGGVQPGAGSTDARAGTGDNDGAWIRHRDTPCG